MVFFFDLDNTLLDDNSAQAKYLPVLFKNFGNYINCSEDEFRQRWREATPRYHQLYAEGAITFEEQRFRRVRDSFNNPSLDEDILRAIIATFDSVFSTSWTLFPETIPVLQKLQDFPLGIITNGSIEQQSRKIDFTNIRSYFDCIVISEEVGIAKPHPEIFHHACSLLHCSPEDCYFIGDSLENDVLGALSAGMKPVWFNSTDTPVPERFSSIKIISNLEEVLKLPLNDDLHPSRANSRNS